MKSAAAHWKGSFSRSDQYRRGFERPAKFGLENEDLEDLKDALETAAEAADRLMAELEQHRVLMLAENRELKAVWRELNSVEILQEAVDCLAGHAVASGKRLTVDRGCASCAITSDRVLLGRVLVNLLKNACEASQAGEEIKLGCRENGAGLEFWVNNPAVMLPEVQLQIFNRSFSTKGSDRGLGTYKH